MGSSLSWIAVRGVHAGVLWSRLGLRPTGRTADAPGSASCAATAEGEWALVCASRDDRLVDGAVLQPLSALGEVVGCFLDERRRLSQAQCWRDGVRAWSAMHHGELALDHLQTSGELPGGFRALEAAALAETRGDPLGPDLVFDVPLDLARSVVGFRHDEADERIFHELEPAPAMRAIPEPSVVAGEPALSTLVRWFRGR